MPVIKKKSINDIPVGFGSKLGAGAALVGALGTALSETLDMNQPQTIGAVVLAILSTIVTVQGRMKQGQARELAQSPATTPVQTKV